MIEKVRKAVGTDYTVWWRLNGQEYGLEKFGIENYITLEEAQQVAQWLEQAGADAISVTCWGMGVYANWHRAKVRKVYDTARTPYQRLLEAGILTQAKREELAATYYGLNPVTLLKQINDNLEQLWTMAQYPTHQQKKVRTCEASVT